MATSSFSLLRAKTEVSHDMPHTTFLTLSTTTCIVLSSHTSIIALPWAWSSQGISHLRYFLLVLLITHPPDSPVAHPLISHKPSTKYANYLAQQSPFSFSALLFPIALITIRLIIILFFVSPHLAGRILKIHPQDFCPLFKQTLSTASKGLCHVIKVVNIGWLPYFKVSWLSE